jgi:hypothetical protein
MKGKRGPLKHQWLEKIKQIRNHVIFVQGFTVIYFH